MNNLEAVITIEESAEVQGNRDLYWWLFRYASQTAFYAPHAVFFEGTDSTGVIVKWEWDFGDGSSTVEGFNTAHVYETPGVYTATLTVYDDQDNTDTATVQIEAWARDGDIYYVDSEIGSDDYDGLSSELVYDSNGDVVSGPWETAYYAFMALEREGEYNPGDQILFRRGHRFPISDSITLSRDGRNYGLLFGAYSMGPKPIIEASHNSNVIEHQYHSGWMGRGYLTFMDLEIQFTNSIDGGRFYRLRHCTATNFLIMNIDMIDQAGFMQIMPEAEDDIRITDVFLVGNNLSNSWETMQYGATERMAMLSNHYDLSGTHLIYSVHYSRGVVKDNIFTRPSWGRHAFRNRSTGDREFRDICINNNYMSGWIDPRTRDQHEELGSFGTESRFSADGDEYNYLLMDFHSTGSVPGHAENYLIENNVFANSQMLVKAAATFDHVQRNNIYRSIDTSGRAAIQVGHDEDVPSKNVEIYSNIMYSHTSSREVIIPEFPEEYEGMTRNENTTIRDNEVWKAGSAEFVLVDEALEEANVFGNTINSDYSNLFNYRGSTYDAAGWETLTGDANTIQAPVNRPPAPGLVKSPVSQYGGSTIELDFNYVKDYSGEGIKEIRLWARKDDGEWFDTGLSHSGNPDTEYGGKAGLNGTFSYTPDLGSGSYYFATEVEDNAGNVYSSQDEPGPGHTRTVYQKFYAAYKIGPAERNFDRGGMGLGV